jgi:hypothetical protein
MKKKILNVITFAMIGWGAISAIYLGLPVEVKELLPNMNWVTALVSGGSTTILGSSILVFNSMMNKSKLANSEVYSSIANLVLEHKIEYQAIVDSNANVILAYKGLAVATDRNNVLLETLLEARLSNPLIEQKIKELIEGVLNDKESI